MSQLLLVFNAYKYIEVHVTTLVFFSPCKIYLQTLFVSVGEKMDNTVLGSQLAGLRVNKDSADVSLICEEQVVMAHSQILGMR